MTGKDLENIGLTITISVVALAASFAVVSVRLGEGFAIPVGIIAAVAVAAVLRGPVGKALARRLEGNAPAGVNEELVAQLDDARVRLAELEERLDFAERVLARGRDAARIGTPEGGPQA